ncbi:alpha-2,3-sialyltransferase, partial [Helicobacter felis]|uniref:alpha-2,3-sialyltransferase n=1 Tax=Helicobacter felis TaxID=214 RepID=UPI001F1B701E
RKPLIIAGNGPSIKNLDYSFFPPDFEVFRCNQFYFEDRYYLGNEVKACFFNPSVFELQMNTARILDGRNEYALCDFYCSTLGPNPYINGKPTPIREFLDKRYIGIRTTHNMLEGLEPFQNLQAKFINLKGQWFTSGVVMLICAIALGYQEIYLAGLDFYADGPGHFYANQSAFFKIHSDSSHNKDLDIEAIELAKQYAKLYALVPNSALSDILPLSLHKNALSADTKERLKLGQTKPEGYINDVILPPHYLECKKTSEKSRKEVLKEFLDTRGACSGNLVFESLRFGRRVCCDVYKFGRACLALCKPKNFKLIFKRNKPTP